MFSIRSVASCRTVRRTLVQNRGFAVHVVGEGWTGALGSGRLDHSVAGHFDEDEVELPFRMFDEDVLSVSVGWGHTAIITSDNKLLMTGRPHDFAALLRINRLPAWLRDYSARQTLESTVNQNSLHPVALIGRGVSWLAEVMTMDEPQKWDSAREQSIMTELTELNLPERPVSVHCSAGFTVVVGESGKGYSFGVNSYGQCGIGVTSNNLWLPQAIQGLSTEDTDGSREELEQIYPIVDIALGLQHGVCLNSEGEVFAWGKGERGQLGQGVLMNESPVALPIDRAVGVMTNLKPEYRKLGKVAQISSGMLHSAALTEDNQVFIWGKNLLPPNPDVVKDPVTDARMPMLLNGLPPLKVERIACGSHHTAVLMEDGSVWAVGVSSDTKQMMYDPVVLIPSGILETPVRYFAAHMDRTSVIGADGRQVLQVHLWESPDLQEYAAFSPPWVERILDEDQNVRIREIHRSWLHSVAITD